MENQPPDPGAAAAAAATAAATRSLNNIEEYIRNIYSSPEIHPASVNRIWEGEILLSAHGCDRSERIFSGRYAIDYRTTNQSDPPLLKNNVNVMNAVIMKKSAFKSSGATESFDENGIFELKNLSDSNDYFQKYIASNELMAVMIVPTQRNKIKDILCVWAIESLNNKIVGFVARQADNFLKKLTRVLDENLPKGRNEMNFLQKLQKSTFTMKLVVNPTKVDENTKNRGNEESDICEILLGQFRKFPVFQPGFFAELQNLMSMTDSTNVTNRPEPNYDFAESWQGNMIQFWEGLLECQNVYTSTNLMENAPKVISVTVPLELIIIKMKGQEHNEIIEFPKSYDKMKMTLMGRNRALRDYVRDTTIINARWFILHIRTSATGAGWLLDNMSTDFVGCIALEESLTKIQRIMIVNYQKKWKKFVGLIPNHHETLTLCRPKIISEKEKIWQGTFELLLNIGGQVKLCMQFVLHQDLVHTRRPLLGLLEGCPRVFRAFLISRKLMRDNMNGFSSKDNQMYHFNTREDEGRVNSLNKLIDKFVIIAPFRRNNIIEVMHFEEKFSDGFFIGTLPRDANKYACILKTAIAQETAKHERSMEPVDPSLPLFNDSLIEALSGNEFTESRYLRRVKNYLNS